MKRRNRALTEIASKHLNISTLRIRKSDSLDFHDVSVWAVRSALKAAFDEGAGAKGMRTSARASGPRRHSTTMRFTV